MKAFAGLTRHVFFEINTPINVEISSPADVIASADAMLSAPLDIDAAAAAKSTRRLIMLLQTPIKMHRTFVFTKLFSLKPDI